MEFSCKWVKNEWIRSRRTFSFSPPLSPFLAIVISNAFVCENIKILFAEIYASKRLLYYKIEWLRFDICGAIEKPDWLKWNA